MLLWLLPALCLLCVAACVDCCSHCWLLCISWLRPRHLLVVQQQLEQLAGPLTSSQAAGEQAVGFHHC